jgi:cobyrinic acid a,c-diamide synthase
MSRSVAALVHGFNTYDPEVTLQGVILNRVKSSAQEKILREALNDLQIPVLGVLPKEAALHLPERHLGLVPVGESGLLEGFIDTLSQLVTKHVDLEQIERIMLRAPDLSELIFSNPTPMTSKPMALENKFRLGLALDEAFLFYYHESLELAKRLNFIIVPFSPLHDVALPPDLDGIFIGGGFPELHLERLSKNVTFLDSLRSYAESGKPVYAECGGYMYLGRSITDFEGREVPLAGLIPMKAEMTKRLQGIGYRRGVLREDTFLGPRGTTVQGHEFHYSRVTYDQEFLPAYELFKGDHSDRMEGYVRDNIVASYLHLHFSGHSELLKHWFTSCSRRIGV